MSQATSWKRVFKRLVPCAGLLFLPAALLTAGPNHVSSFHVIGEIFDKVHPEGATETLTNVQSTLVPAGGATIVEFKTKVPGTYILVDHRLGRLQKGAAGNLEVEGPPNTQLFKSVKAGA
jgi:nitrite reductase (NO-forming)